MTEQQVIIVKRTWKLFQKIDPVIVGDTLYSKLFSDHPGLRKMFPKDMEAQYRKLMDILSTIIARLDMQEHFPDEVLKMAQRHIGYDVKPVHFDWVGTALLWTLQQGLGSDWTDEVKSAWTNCYGSVSTIMMESSLSAVTK